MATNFQDVLARIQALNTRPRLTRGQRQQSLFSGLSNLGAALFAAGAPSSRPGPNAFAALPAFTQGVNARRNQFLAQQERDQIRRLKEMGLAAQIVDSNQRDTTQRTRAGADRLKQLTELGTGLVKGAPNRAALQQPEAIRAGNFIEQQVRNTALAMGRDPEQAASEYKAAIQATPTLAEVRAEKAKTEASNTRARIRATKEANKGQVSGADTARISRLVGESLGGQIDELGRVSNLPPALASKMPELVKKAEDKIQSGEADAIGDAVAQVLAETELPERVSLRGVAETLENIPAEDSGGDQVKKLQLSDATGLGSGVKDFVQNKLLGNISDSAVDPDVVRARQELALLANDFIVAEKRSPRLPVWEQMRLSRIFTEPDVWRSPEQVRVQLVEFDKRLTSAIEREKLFLDVPLGSKEKRETLNNIRQLAMFRARVRKFDLEKASGSIFGGSDEAPSPQTPGIIDFNSLPD